MPMASAMEVDVVVVGAGLAGLYQLHKLRDELGLSARVIEAASGVGGTWFWNKYPGARCDIDSMGYSYSFSPELEQEWSWTEKYATQPEILRYINHVADRFDLRRDITLNTRVTSAVYNEGSKRWEVRTDQGGAIRCQFLVMAVGCLTASKMPEVPGVEKFRGLGFHTGHWPEEGVDFTGQRVAVIGTGSSGVQSIPIFAQQASELTVFQRTPSFSCPANNRPLSEEEIADIKANYRLFRDKQPVVNPQTQSALEVSEEERRAKFEGVWDHGLLAVMACYNDLLVNKQANDTIAELFRQKIRSIVKDPETAETLSPRTYALGTKRLCVDTEYFNTYNSPHVHLVDLTKTPILEITANGVRTTATEYEFDAIVYATGYDAVTGPLTRIDIRGKGGMGLREKWAKGARTYMGVAVAGFPNFFTITGPLSPAVLTNMIVSIEQHVEWITDCIAYLRAHGIQEIDPAVEAEDEWVAHAAAVANFTLFPATNSYYTGGNVLNKPHQMLAYVGGLPVYRQKCNDVAAKGYEGFNMTPACDDRQRG